MTCRTMPLVLAAVLLIMLSAAPAAAQRLTLRNVRDKPDEWFTSDEGRRVIDIIIAAQVPTGGWRKGYDLTKLPDAQTAPDPDWAVGTFDNGSTHTELRLLARAYKLTQRKEVLDSFNRGLDYIFMSQYPNGGWPQRYPLPDDYGVDITFNDQAMTQVMLLLDDVVRRPEFAFVDAERRAKAKAAFDRGLDCILKLQITLNGKLSGWAQQYDPVTLAPAKARSYELPSIASMETVGIVQLLMRIDHPSPEVRRAIRSAVEWLNSAKITGQRVERRPDPNMPRGFDVAVVPDPLAPPLWARFYDLETGKPLYVGRDGVKHATLAEVEPERRSGYAYLRAFAETIPQEYAEWAARHGDTTAPKVLPIKDNAVELLDKPDAWFASDEGIRRIEAIIAAQLPSGGWAKGYDPVQYEGAAPPGRAWAKVGTIDNAFTYTELHVLARAYRLTQRPAVLESFHRGLDFLLAAQYPGGGWPQRYPPPADYGRLITFNDDAMVNVMKLMKDIAASDDFAFVDPAQRARAKAAFDKGVECILKCQIVVNGKPTAWCQQHDPATFQPALARTYELPSITGRESVEIVRLLMTIDDPSPEVQRAIRSAVAWFERSKVTGIRVEQRPDPSLPKGFDRYVVEDPSAEPLWARCYDIETNRPFFCGRDGVKKWSMAEIEPERRSYTWLDGWAKTLLSDDYPKWAAKYPPVSGDQ